MGASRCRLRRAHRQAASPGLFAHRSAKIDFLVQILRGNSFEEFGEGIFLARDRFDDNAAGFLTHVHGIIQAKLGGLEDCGGNAHRGAVAPFLDDSFHRRSPPPCRNIVSTAVIKLKAEIGIRSSFSRHSPARRGGAPPPPLPIWSRHSPSSLQLRPYSLTLAFPPNPPL